ncbi:UPF0182 family protein [Thermosulfurimonas sp. F29]|uniref:UPF0182 family membrane protein n=1 Tax=Thermosulfurimonas sp. F29 TaxID=2867247 RepID=UPI001C8325F0|nr:UPF0182 family protein [Thermosulfurimonas sp. F29]MBX6423028.1 UPF0182 family protein [Thermosulfurimonas sp. F29]
MKVRLSVLILALLGLAVGLFSPFVRFYTDYLWFRDLGYARVFLVRYQAEALLFGVSALLAGLIFYLHGYLVQRQASRGGLWAQYLDPRLRRILSEKFRLLLRVVSLILALSFGLSSRGLWSDFLLALHGKGFGLKDPLLSLDVGFYVFRLPFLRYLGDAALALWTLLFLSGVLVFLAQGHLERGGPLGVRLTPTFRRYLAVMLALFFLRLAYDLFLDRADLLFDERGVVFGAGYTEARVVLPALNALVLLSLAAAVLSALFVLRPRREILLGLTLGYALIYFLGLRVLPGVVHRYVVQPNELDKEKTYIAYEIRYTREGFGLNRVVEKPFRFGKPLTYADLQRNASTIKNIRLWDHQPLLETYSQIQEIRTYYRFVSVDNDRYLINGELRQVMLSARELSYEDLPSKSWINLHLIYTHGYGLTLGVVNQVSPEGLPVLLIKDIPPRSVIDLRVKRPEIYFGELTTTYAVVDTRLKEFDYPAGEENVYTTYRGKTGVRVGGIFRRLLFAYRFGTSKFLFSRDIRSESRILYYREVRGRVKRLAPFLLVDPDPYLVIGKDGRLFWFVDLYTVSDRFPYSRRVKGLGNYIRNSALAVVDAYHGTVRFYLKDPRDPLIRTYQEIFGIFRPLSELREDLRRHIRYPHRLFSLQARLYARYHMTDPRVFYNQEDLWEIPKSPRDPRRYIRAYYTIMRLPGETSPEFILMVPFTPARKNNLSAWMCVRCDPEHYGEMLVYRFPKQTLVYGPQQIESRINQDPDISRQLSLWDQRGSRVILGTLLVIPIEGNLLYVQPLYLKSETGQIPELKRVIVAYGGSIAMAPTLEEALLELFGSPLERAAYRTRRTVSGILRAAKPRAEATREFLRELYRRAEEALRRGDLEEFGRLWKKLGEALR